MTQEEIDAMNAAIDDIVEEKGYCFFIKKNEK